MDNKTIAKTFKQYAQLMELHGGNPFRTKAMTNAAFKLGKLPFSVTLQTVDKLREVPGLGPSTAEKVRLLLETGAFPEWKSLLADTPGGITEVLKVKGPGPGNIKIIWRDLGLEAIG